MAKSIKIRKNAHKKIAALLDRAQSVSFRRYSMDWHSDCYVWGDTQQKTVEDVKTFLIDSYESRTLSIYAITDENDNVIKLEVGDYFNDFDIVIGAEVEAVEAAPVEAITVKTCKCCEGSKSVDLFFPSKKQKDGFSVWCKECNQAAKDAKKQGIEFVPVKAAPVEAVEEIATPTTTEDTTQIFNNLGIADLLPTEPKKTIRGKLILTYAQVREALDQGFVSPLHHDHKAEEIKTVQVLSSESNVVNLRKGEAITLADWEAVINLSNLCSKYPNEHDKTNLVITTWGGDENRFTFMHKNGSESICEYYARKLQIEAENDEEYKKLFSNVDK